MNLKNWNHAARLALLLPLIAAAGCTGSDVLTPNTGNFSLQMEIVNIPVDYRFGDNDRDRAKFTVLQIGLRPADPNAAAVLGQTLGEANTLNLLRSPIGVNHDVSPKVIWDEANLLQDSPPPLTTGTWILEEVIIARIDFIDRDETDPATCHSYINEYDSSMNDEITLNDFSPEIRFSIEGGADNQYSLIIDWGALTQALQESWPCYQCAEPWCIIPYNFGIGFEFAGRVNEFVSFE